MPLSTAKALAQHARIAHRVRSLAAACVPRISRCQFCETEFHSRSALVAHLSDLRVRSKVRGTCCGPLYVQSDPAPLAPDLARLLHAEAKAERRDAFKSGHSHPLVKVPAVPAKRKVTSGIPTQLLSQVRAKGVRRRIPSKTPHALALLQFAPRTSVQSPLGAANRRIRVKTSLSELGLTSHCFELPCPKRKRLRVKTPQSNTAYLRYS